MNTKTTVDIDHIDFLIRLYNTNLKFSQLSATKQKYSIYLHKLGFIRFGELTDDQDDLVFLTDKGRNLLVLLTQGASDYEE